MSKNKKEAVVEDIDKMLEMVSRSLKRKEDREALAGRLLSDDAKREMLSVPLPKEVRRQLGLLVPVTIFVQDPLVAKENPELGLQDIELNWEPGLDDGPTSARVAVVDYDIDTKRLEESAKWDREKWSFVGPDGKRLDRENNDNFQFHQVNVWGIVSRILEFYEDCTALGRPVRWGFDGNRLIVMPHAGYQENAFYDGASKALQFYYCGAKDKPVYTSLSHDIVAHETGHAVLDGIRPLYLEHNSLQSGAFHEFAADLTAILSAMRNNDVRRELAKVTEGDLKKAKSLANLAEEFARIVIGRDYLRSAFNSNKMDTVKEGRSPHFCSQVLTGAMFDIMTRMAANYMERENKKGKRHTPYQALWYTIDRFRRVALQPLDYCPPVDIRFEDYADAVLARDRLTNPEDPYEYRKIMREVFKERQIPCLEEGDEPAYTEYYCPNIGYLATSRTAAYGFLHEKRELLRIPAEHDIVVADLYSVDKVRRAYRRLPREIVMEYVWGEDVRLEGSRFKNLEGETASLLCGGTLVYDELGNLLYWCRKPGTCFKTRVRGEKAGEREEAERKAGENRRQQFLDYIAYCVKQGIVGLTDEEDGKAPDIRTPFTGRRVDGKLRLKTIPHLRHFGEGEDG